jgi:hypothetical protein
MEGLYRFELVYYLEVSLKERRYVFSSPRMRWADIEVPNLVVDVAIIFPHNFLWLRLSHHPFQDGNVLHFIRTSSVF